MLYLTLIRNNYFEFYYVKNHMKITMFNADNEDCILVQLTNYDNSSKNFKNYANAPLKSNIKLIYKIGGIR